MNPCGWQCLAPGTDSRIHTLTLVCPLLALHRLTNSHFHGRVSAPRAAQTHEITLSRSCVRSSRCTDSRIHTLTLVRPTCVPQLHSFTLSRSRARLALRRFADALCHACAPGLSRPVPHGLMHSRSHVLTLARPIRMDSRLFKYSGFHVPSLICLAFTDSQRSRVPAKLAWRACFFTRLHGMYGCTFCSREILAMYACGSRCPGRRYHVSFVNALCVWHPDASGPAANPR